MIAIIIGTIIWAIALSRWVWGLDLPRATRQWLVALIVCSAAGVIAGAL